MAGISEKCGQGGGGPVRFRLGARLTGGGFGGAVLALVRRGTEEGFVQSIGERVSRAWERTPQTLVTGAGGA
jgi:galactokinase